MPAGGQVDGARDPHFPEHVADVAAIWLHWSCGNRATVRGRPQPAIDSDQHPPENPRSQTGAFPVVCTDQKVQKE